MSSFAIILPAAGKSSRFGGLEKKPFVTLDGRAVWLRTADAFRSRPDVCGVWLVLDADDLPRVRDKHGPALDFLDIRLVAGGAERFESVANALAVLPDEAEYVAVHDAVRPLITSALIDAVFDQAKVHGAALLGVPVADTVKEVDTEQFVTRTIPRANLYLAQTPQAFRRDWLVEAYARRGEFASAITDDAQLVEATGRRVQMVPGHARNFKITTQADLSLAEALLQAKEELTKPRHPFADDDMWS